MIEAPMAYRPTRMDKLRRCKNLIVAWAISDTTVGGESVPNSWASLKIKGNPRSYPGVSRYNIGFGDDAHMVQAWSGFEGESHEHDSTVVYVPATVFRRMAIWYLWRWAVGEWFGLRRWLFYKRLHRKVARWTRPEQPAVPLHIGAAPLDTRLDSNLIQ